MIPSDLEDALRVLPAHHRTREEDRRAACELGYERGVQEADNLVAALRATPRVLLPLSVLAALDALEGRAHAPPVMRTRGT